MFKCQEQSLVLGNSNKALDYVQKAKNIFIHDRSRNNENLKKASKIQI